MRHLSAARIIELLALEPLAGEGGMWAPGLRDEHSSAIYFLLRPHDPSLLHRLTGPEVWHFYAGAPVQMLLLHAGGRVERPVLGIDLEVGQRPQVAAPGRVWQGGATTGPWSLVGTTMAPPYAAHDFELGDVENLASGWPAAAGEIRALRRSA